MPRSAPQPARKPASRRKQIVWLRAVPIFVIMMGALFAAQYLLAPRFPGNLLFGNGSLGLSLIAGLIGAFLISRFATVEPPPPPPTPSKSQQRKLARAERLSTSAETEEPVAVGSSNGTGRKRRRRR